MLLGVFTTWCSSTVFFFVVHFHLHLLQIGAGKAFAFGCTLRRWHALGLVDTGGIRTVQLIEALKHIFGFILVVQL